MTKKEFSSIKKGEIFMQYIPNTCNNLILSLEDYDQINERIKAIRISDMREFFAESIRQYRGINE